MELTVFLANTSDYQRQLFWQQLAPVSEDVDGLRSVFAWLPDSPGLGPQTKLSASEDSSTVLASFAAVARLFPPSAVPGLLVLIPEDDWGEAALTAIVQLAEVVPQIPVALALRSSGPRLTE